MANNITNKQIFDLIKMGVQVENGMKSSDVLSLETLENMSTMLMYFRKFLLINVDQDGDLDLRLGVDFFNNLFAIIITNKKRCKNSKERRNFI